MQTNAVIVTLVAALLAPVAAVAAGPVPDLPIPRNAAVILDTGSTNTAGYRIVVQRDGRAEYIVNGKRQHAKIDPATTGEFFAAMSAAMPFPTIKPCMKSASFGSARFVWWRGHRSGDISCPSTAEVDRLRVVAQKVAATLGVPALSRVIPMLPHEPRRILTTAPPTP